MAHPRRVKMVQQQIHRELADMLLHDTVLQQAIAPESSLGADMYLSSMATISDVEISKDLQVLFLFFSRMHCDVAFRVLVVNDVMLWTGHLIR